jgi:BirA family transcriptional regulator, biotin operon repressor / biotin---[acetyl-CoA-carboxylase] ligase
MENNIVLLNKDEIIKSLTTVTLNKLDSLIINKKTGSTNDDAKNSLKDKRNQLCVHFAEQQNSGRGRSGKSWVSPFAKNIYFSIGWKSNLSLNELDGLSLAAAVVVSESLQEFIKEPLEIKWPNDILINNKKVGGILIETSSNEDGLLEIIIGVGINIFMDDEEAKSIDQAWVNLEQHKISSLDKDSIAANLINGMTQLTEDFENSGFKYFKEAFELRNNLTNKQCKILDRNNQEKIGLVKGINSIGELLIKINNEIISLRYGEVSIREL